MMVVQFVWQVLELMCVWNCISDCRRLCLRIALLHGESEPYFRTPLVVATTHQLLKFYHAFDLLIVDEVDAFPYVDNQMLYHAVKNSVKENGMRIFLTALHLLMS